MKIFFQISETKSLNEVLKICKKYISADVKADVK